MKHYVYLARCSDGTLYTGTCLDKKARQDKHNAGEGAKYTRTRRPIQIIYSEEYQTLGKARSREAEIKKLSRADKENLIKNTK
jgi:putative endonuclease